MSRTNRIRFCIGLAALQVVDLATTAWALAAGAEETNPIVGWLGWYWTAGAKIGVSAAIILLSLQSSDEEHAFDRALQLALVLYLATCLLNVRAAVTSL